MKKNILKIVSSYIFLLISTLGFSQDAQMEVIENNSYDPLVAQHFAVDSKTQTFAVLNSNENTFEIIKMVDTTINGQKQRVLKNKQFLIDQIAGRHDVAFIFRPMSVAIYEGHIVYLASSRDSSMVRLTDLDGKILEEFRFNGAASAFSYDSSVKKLYIAGENPTGYDLFIIDASKGFENLSVEGSSSFHYKKPKKSEEILAQDPWGIGLTVIAMSTVFLTLLVMIFVLKGETKILFAYQNAKAKKAMKGEEFISTTPIKKPSDISGEEFAAIAAAIYMYNSELHDEENTILTINKVQKTYSPWSSKLYNMNVYKR